VEKSSGERKFRMGRKERKSISRFIVKKWENWWN